MKTTTSAAGSPRWSSRDAKKRAGQALSRAANTNAGLAQAIRRSEQLTSRMRLGRKKGAVGRTIEIVWQLERHSQCSSAPIIRELLCAQRESQIQHPPAVLSELFRSKLVDQEPVREGQENLGTNLYLAGEIDLRTWREEYFWPELEVALDMDAIAEHLIGRDGER